MRLLHTTNLELVSFIGKPVKERPRYAILSHRWKDDEFLFEEARNGISQHLQNPRTGLQKILNACDKARQNNLDYIWVDTCCIDKSSSAELSEAINSMFKWYMESSNCYVFMDDVTLQEDGVMGNFDDSRWFTRGWTLQELIAPHGLFFFDRDWKYMCRRDEIASRLEEITGITQSILQRAHIFPPPAAPHPWTEPKFQCPGCGHIDQVKAELMEEPISRKMIWAANRVTTRPEDTSYCLLGLFDINMPLLYGEGENAFWRLQEEILKKSPDQSILTWTDDSSNRLDKPYLPMMPSAFQFAVRRPEKTLIERGDIIATARGLEIDVLLGPCAIRDKKDPSPMEQKKFMAILSCAVAPDPLPRVAILVEPLTPGAPDTAYTRVHNLLLIQLYPAAEPSILAAVISTKTMEVQDPVRTVLRREIIEIQDAVVEYDPGKLSPSRILLAAIRPARGHFKQRTGVYIVAPGIERVKINVRQWTPSGDAMISYERPSSWGEGRSTLSIGGAWQLANDHFSFFVLWGVPSNSANGDFVTWTETWESFLQGNLSDASPSSLEWRTFGAGLQQYVGKHRGTLSPYVSEPGFKVKVNVNTNEFLGRKTYRVILDIEGWEDSPVSIVNCLQVVAPDWT
ncbi:HET domain-containing protein [Fusarium sp. Ph1]|nr:HET domain-containing protein [Fusarium sp. Ph1]